MAYIREYGHREEVEDSEAFAAHGKDGKVRILRLYLQVAETSRRLAQANGCADSLSAVSRQSGLSERKVGEWQAEEAKMQSLPCLVHAEGFSCPQNLWVKRMPIKTWEVERWLAVGSRVNRLGGLGNAVVPQIPELYARHLYQLLTSASAQKGGACS